MDRKPPRRVRQERPLRFPFGKPTKLIRQVRFRVPSSSVVAPSLLDPVSLHQTAVSIQPVGSREIAAAALALEGAPAEEIVAWAAGRFGSGLALTASFQDCVLIDLAVGVVPDLSVVFLDTQYHFPETLAYVEHVRERYDLDLVVSRPRVGLDDRWRSDLDGCCAVRKIEPLDRALVGRSAWMSGLRRDEAPARAGTQVVARDERRGLVKVNPLATWSDDDVAHYAAERDLPVHPLLASGYRSIGCWPCTTPVAAGADPRAGRWAASEKTECGLHL
ncbi:MAG: phosphoadenylyl-sulfate reductase [Acidimicrobiia bacterium]|nr:phosphoadenylyl-sulfate reductase [Acidimicrobiia bacterium]